MMLQLMQDVNTMSLDKFQADILATRAQYERSDAILGEMGVGWTPSFLSTCYPNWVEQKELLVQQVANDLWFTQMDYARNEQGRTIRRNMTSAEEDLMALALRTKPHTNAWLCLSLRVCTLGEDAFEHALAVIKEIHAYLINLFNERELGGGMMLKLMQDVNTMSLDKF